MKDDCQKGYGFWREDDALRVDPDPTCRTFNVPSRITGLLGHDFRSDGAEAYRAAKAGCANHGTIDFQHDGDGPLQMVCNTPLKPLSKTFALTAPP